MILLTRAVLFSGLAAAMLGVVYGWYRWRSVSRDATLTRRRRIISSVGLVAVTAQACLLMTIYGRLSNIYPTLFDDWWAAGQMLLFLIAIPCILTGKGLSRWWLSASSVFLIVFCYLILIDT
jgi:hypothetical protein